MDFAITIHETVIKHLAMNRRCLKHPAEIQIPSWLVVIKVTDAVKIPGDDQRKLINIFQVVLNFRMGKKIPQHLCAVGISVDKRLIRNGFVLYFDKVSPTAR